MGSNIHFQQFLANLGMRKQFKSLIGVLPSDRTFFTCCTLLSLCLKLRSAQPKTALYEISKRLAVVCAAAVSRGKLRHNRQCVRLSTRIHDVLRAVT